jgi:hypothetical protein
MGIIWTIIMGAGFIGAIVGAVVVLAIGILRKSPQNSLMELPSSCAI